LAAYLDGQLAPEARARVEADLASSERLRVELEQIREGMESMRALPLVEAPDRLWAAIEASLDRPLTGREAPFRWRLAFGAAALAAFAAVALWYAYAGRGEAWQVTRLAGSPSVASERIVESARIRRGEWVETDGSSRARIRVGEIGTIDVAPNTRLTVLAARPAEHRLELSGGEIHATILAPPRLFFVETPSGTAVDLGCEYTLRCDRLGDGILQVQAGWVAFEHEDRESLVPAGASCRLRSGAGPGIPYFEDAPVALVESVEAFDSGAGAVGAVGAILAAARMRDTLTLWHLLSRVAPDERIRVYERMAALSPPPDGLSRERVLALDPGSLTRWREELAWTW
jgi:hypothetical protein